MPMRTLTRVVILMLGALAVGCDSAGDAAQPNGPAGGKHARKQVSPEAAALTANMVSAVNTGTDSSPVDVKFELTQRPEVGKPVDISLVLIPTAPLERLFARFQTDDGLELVKGAETEQIARPVSGTAISHTVTVIPKRDGIFTILAIVLMDSASESVSRNFSIPLIAGSGLSEWAPQRAVARSTPHAESPENPAHR